MTNSILIKDLTKTYSKGTVSALSQINLQVKPGELFGLIGPDGAGKTTLFRVLCSLLLPDEGSVIVSGHDVVRDPFAVRKILGYMPGRFSLYQDLTIEENLNFFATVFGTTVEENYDLIRDIYVQIEPFKKRPAGKLSGGMKQKLALCCALVHQPHVLILDEPTTGVDPMSRKEFWDSLQRLKEKGITIIASTPYMDEASRCDRIALIQGGRILNIGTLPEIINSHEINLFSAKGENMYVLLKDLRMLSEVDYAFSFGSEHHFALKDMKMNGQEIKKKLEVAGHSRVDIKPIEKGIEDIFIHQGQ